MAIRISQQAVKNGYFVQFDLEKARTKFNIVFSLLENKIIFYKMKCYISLVLLFKKLLLSIFFLEAILLSNMTPTKTSSHLGPS